MSDIKELKEEELKQVSGGQKPEGATAKYDNNRIVYGLNDRKYKISYSYWSDACNCFCYDATIVFLPEYYTSGIWSVGDNFTLCEYNILGYAD